MIKDIVDDEEACSQTELFSLFWNHKRSQSSTKKRRKRLPSFQHVLDLCAKMVAGHFSPDDVIHLIMDIPGSGVESNDHFVKTHECLTLIIL